MAHRLHTHPPSIYLGTSRGQLPSILQVVAPFRTVSATGAGVATGLGNFVDTQSHCTNGNFSFNQGIFDLVSTDTPGDSLFGTYNGTASLQNGLLEFTATLLVNGGTGLFANDFGTVLSSGALNENTGAFSASFSGSVGTVPEPSTVYLVLVALAVAYLIRIKAYLPDVNSR